MQNEPNMIGALCMGQDLFNTDITGFGPDSYGRNRRNGWIDKQKNRDFHLCFK